MCKHGSIILIPAYQPPSSLLSLVADLAALDRFQFVIVNDGSSEDKELLFEELARRSDVTVLTHGANLGKGHALKTGINHVLVECPEATGILTVDADGQHLPEDVAKVAEALKENPEALCLGVRQFNGKVPLRSRIGNAMTRTLFKVCSGTSLHDTQTGLRGLPIDFARKMLSVSADGYEFEFESLFSACGQSVPIVQVDIQTVYEKGNPTSHFNPLLDSLKIYFVFFRFISASLVVSLIDMVVFSMAFFASEQLLGSMIAGRICAGASQFLLSKHFVFYSKQDVVREVGKYALLVVVLMGISYKLIELVAAAGMNVYLAKIVIDTLLFFTSFTLQRVFIFKRKA